MDDTQTALAQHQAALDAHAALLAGDQAAYAAAIQRLYALGYTNAAAMSADDLLDVANSAAPVNFLGSLEIMGLWAIGILGVIFLGPPIYRAITKRRAA